MWNPKSIELVNLMTHLNTKYVFKKNTCVMVYGINKTDSGSDSNGTGKSTILEAITLAISGVTNRDVNKDEFINDDEDETYIQFDLENNLGDINSLSIRRWFYRKKSSKIELWENGELNKEMTSVNEANKRIYELIGLTKDDLMHFFIIGQDTNYSFLTAGDTEKKDIISRFSNIEFINEKIDELKSQKKDLTNEIEEIKKDIQKLDNKNEFLNEQKQDLKDNFETEKKSRISSLKKKRSKYKKSNKELEEEKKTQEDKLDEHIGLIGDIILESNDKIEENIKAVNKSIRDEKTNLNELKLDKKHLELVMGGKITCPDCNSEFLIQDEDEDKIDLKKIPAKIKKLTTDSESIEIKIKKLNKKLNKLNEKLSRNEELEDEKNALEKSKKRIELSLTTKTDEIIENDISIARLRKKIKKIEKEKSGKQIEQIDSEIEVNEEMLQVLNSSKTELEDEYQDADFWIYHFGKKGFMTFLTNKSVKSIEGITNSFLKKMNSDLQVNIDGFTELKNGDIREKINVDIVRKGMRVGNFKRYSGGEKGRINLANILGLQKLINMTCETGGLNFLALDEVFEGLDQSGQKDVLNILENLSITSFVVTHRNQPIGAENELFIEKLDGISTIVQ